MAFIRACVFGGALALVALTAPATTSISIIGSAGPGAFTPNPVTVASGASVVWTNNDVTVHHIVLDDGSYDGGILIPGSTSPPAAVPAAGGTYHCVIHPSMTGTITVSPSCSFSVAPTSVQTGAAGGAAALTVTASAGCAWTATSNSSFITIVSGASGTGNGTVSYTVAANPSTTPRTGTMTVAGLTVTINQAGAAVCPPISIAPPTLANMTQGIAVSVTLTASGGTAPYVFTVPVGSPPAGVALSAAGVLSGTPTSSGAFNFTVRATDAAGCVSDQPYSVTVLPSVPSMPQTLTLVFALALIAAGWWRLHRRARTERP